MARGWRRPVRHRRANDVVPFLAVALHARLTTRPDIALGSWHGKKFQPRRVVEPGLQRANGSRPKRVSRSHRQAGAPTHAVARPRQALWSAFDPTRVA